MDNSSAPIGIFDSGIGGLTVAHAIKEVLPNERLIYFGDTAHLPYGDKSAAAVQAYSIKITDLLINQGCKAIVIACNTASSVANELLKEYTASRAKVINVVDPMVELVAQQTTNERVGVIGTKGTIASSIYRSKLVAKRPELQVQQLPTPLLVPMIEEGFIHNKVSQDIIDTYLSSEKLNDITHIVLGCTHYPLIKDEIANYYDQKIVIHDSSLVTAGYLKNYLIEYNLQNLNGSDEQDHFYVSDFTADFERSANYFFSDKVRLEQYKLWE
ncbi:MAG: glutamate racemase [Bacteroidetes bacterium]|nr:MAG: glutamate racemase [Bacteroidota bacterium]